MVDPMLRAAWRAWLCSARPRSTQGWHHYSNKRLVAAAAVLELARTGSPAVLTAMRC